jgi:hypothetical protein
MSETTVIGLVWLDPQEYDQFRAACVDGDDLQDTYEEWLADAQRVFDIASAAGHHVEKIPVRLAEFSIWCRLKGLPMNADSRSRYANEAVRLKHQAG